MHQRQGAHIEPAPVLSLSAAAEHARHKFANGVSVHVRFGSQFGVLKVVEGVNRSCESSPAALLKGCESRPGMHCHSSPGLPPSDLTRLHERVSGCWPPGLG
jgi:hypothetical protein